MTIAIESFIRIEVGSFVGVPGGIDGDICQTETGSEEQNQRHCQGFEPARACHHRAELNHEAQPRQVASKGYHTALISTGKISPGAPGSTTEARKVNGVIAGWPSTTTAHALLA